MRKNGGASLYPYDITYTGSANQFQIVGSRPF